jgi:hypothetical protein
VNTYICPNCWTASGLLFPLIVSGNMTAYQQKKWTKHHSPVMCYGCNSVFGPGFDLGSYYALLAAACTSGWLEINASGQQGLVLPLGYFHEHQHSKRCGLHAALARARQSEETDAGVYRKVRRWLDRTYLP